MMIKQLDVRCKLLNRNLKLGRGFIKKEDGKLEPFTTFNGYGNDDYEVGQGNKEV